MTTNDKDYIRNYMKEYIKSSQRVRCNLCDGVYKAVYKYKHIKTSKHINIEKFNSSFIHIN
jgi:hypothetical protein